MLVELIKKTHKTIVENSAIMLYLVVFLILSNCLALCVYASKIPIIMIVLVACLYFLTTGFLSGWLHLINELTNPENIKDKKYFPIFLEGVGKNFASISIGMLIYFVILISLIVLTSIVASKFVGSIDFIKNEMMTFAQNSSENVFDFINGLSDEQKYILYGWQICFIITGVIFNYLFMFYFPTIINDNKHNIFLRPFIAIYKTLCFTFKNFLSSIGLYALIYFLYVVLEIVSTIASRNQILGFIVLVLFIYFISCVVMLVFNYYESKNNSSDGTDSVGENEIINSIGESN